MAEVSEVTTIASSISEPARARRFVARVLQGNADDAVVEDAVLVTSELVTNVVMHAPGGGHLRVSSSSGVVRIEVDDTGSGALQPRRPAAHQETGRGLLVVSALASAWGRDPVPGGQRVWVELGAD